MKKKINFIKLKTHETAAPALGWVKLKHCLPPGRWHPTYESITCTLQCSPASPWIIFCLHRTEMFQWLLLVWGCLKKQKTCLPPTAALTDWLTSRIRVYLSLSLRQQWALLLLPSEISQSVKSQQSLCYLQQETPRPSKCATIRFTTTRQSERQI